MINTPGLNLKPYSALISNICSKGKTSYLILRCWDSPCGGINAPVSLLKTLNGTAGEPNTAFTSFLCYDGLNASGAMNDWSGEVDFTYTSLTSMAKTWRRLTVILPSCFKNFYGNECAKCTLDYRNNPTPDFFYSKNGGCANYKDFGGYEVVSSESDFDDLKYCCGSRTKSLKFGQKTDKFWAGANYSAVGSGPSRSYNISSCISRASNLESLELYCLSNITDISSFNQLKLKNLIIEKCSLTDLNIPKTESISNLAQNLEKLEIRDCSNLGNLEELSLLTNLNELVLENDSITDPINVTIDYEEGTKSNLKVCKYITDYCTSINKVSLVGTSGISDVSSLTSAGFSETESGSKIFEKSVSSE